MTPVQPQTATQSICRRIWCHPPFVPLQNQDCEIGGQATIAGWRRVFCGLLAFQLLLASGVFAQAPPAGPSRSIIRSISGFDKQRIEAVSAWWRRPDDSQALSEAAKLMFQVNRLGRSSLASRPIRSDPTLSDPLLWEIGDAIAVDGRARSIAVARVPEALADVLEFSEIYRIEIETDQGTAMRVLATSIPGAWQTLWSENQTLDEPMSAIGMVVSAGGDTEPRLIATPKIAWFPTAESSPGDSTPEKHWALLARHGFDVSMIQQLQRLNRQKLVAADQLAFYSMLRAAAQVQPDDLPQAKSIDAAELLKNPNGLIGQRIELQCQSVRITRITLNNPTIVAALGADHYWQIDALGDLGNVVIRIEPEDKTVEPATFVNRYPVSLATMKLPDFLAQAMNEGQPDGLRNDVLMLSQQLLVEGFFYRLWSYENELMQQHGGDNQFGPLVMASQIIDIEPPRNDVVGVGKIGQWAAIAAVAMMLAAGTWIYTTSRQDAKARAKRELDPVEPVWSEVAPPDNERR